MAGSTTRRYTTLLVGLQLLLATIVIAGSLSHVFSLRRAALDQHLEAAVGQARIVEDQLTQTLNLANLTLQGLAEAVTLPPEPASNAQLPGCAIFCHSQAAASQQRLSTAKISSRLNEVTPSICAHIALPSASTSSAVPL